jgi:hypothetical protein
VSHDDSADLLEERNVTCPCCWQTISLIVDRSVRAQSYVEDCTVCCQPLLVRYSVDLDGALSLDVEAENQ